MRENYQGLKDDLIESLELIEKKVINIFFNNIINVNIIIKLYFNYI
jgi:hypothetical protein